MTIVERIAKRISEIFPDVTIYSEKQKSGFQVPSFYISKIMTVTKSRFFERDILKLALDDDKEYTIAEVQKAIDKFKEGF